jgi:hypothetical protein
MTVNYVVLLYTRPGGSTRYSQGRVPRSIRPITHRRRFCFCCPTPASDHIAVRCKRGSWLEPTDRSAHDITLM